MPKLKSEENTCDMCHDIRFSENLIWITADDFEPLQGEVLPEGALNKYDALCEPCYYSLLIK